MRLNVPTFSFTAAAVLSTLAASAFAQASFHARYREAANVFVILDCVSDWWPDFCRDKGAYRRGFEARAGLRPEDATLLAEYGRLREKYYKDPPVDGVFVSAAWLTSDPVKNVFFGSDRVDEALARLSGVVSSEEVLFLKSFYSAFSSRLAPYLEESRAFEGAASRLDASLSRPEYAAFFDEIARFYGVSGERRYSALYAWWPPLDRDHAHAAGDNFIFQKNPVIHLNRSEDDIFFHEVVHLISARQPSEQKRGLTEAFQSRCTARIQNGGLFLLEEPLAVAIGQMLFLKRFDPTRFARETSWFTQPYVNRFSQAIFPLIEQAFASGGRLDAALAATLGDECAKLNR